MAKNCPKGFVRRNGRCVPAPKKGPKDVAPNIPGVQVQNPAGRSAVNRPGEGVNNPPGRGPANPRGACPTGFVWDVASKKCVRRKGSDAKARNNCPEGYYWDAEAQFCRKLKADPGGCPEGYQWNARQGVCVPTKTCPEGMVFKDGQCTYPDQGYCPDGYHLENGQCVRNQQGECPTGYMWDAESSRCVIDPDSAEGPAAENPCGEGTVWDDVLEMCVPDTSEADAPEFIGHDDQGREIWRDPVTGELTYKTPVHMQNELMADVSSLLEQYGLNTPGLLDFARNAIAKGWSTNQIILELRKHPDYLANPLFAANIQRAKDGKRFMSEAEILAWSTSAKQIARKMGYAEPSNFYLAQGLLSGLSEAEILHRLEIQKTVNELGAGVKWVFENELGIDIGDDDLFEIFDPEHDTADFERAYKQAQYRGRPLLLGLGVRSETEARALEMLGIDPNEAYARYENVAQNATRFDRLAAIEGNIIGNLPEDFGNFSSAENSLLIRGLLFQDPRALAELQAMTSREVARFNVGGGVATSNGMAVGLLTSGERQSFA